MTIRKFVAIRNVGRFHSSTAAGDVELKKFNLIYGENGRGKTTLCAILRSLQTGNPGHIVGRQTLGLSGEPFVHVLMGGDVAAAKFEHGAWTATLDQLAIYDQVFIAENVYLGDGVGTEQKRNLFKVILGRAAVQKALRLDQLVRDIRTSASAIRDANRAVESHLKPGLTLKELIDAQPDPSIDAKITQAEADLRSVSAADALMKHPGFKPVTLPEKPARLSELLSETIDSVSAGAERQIGEHLASHNMRVGGQAWISQGMDYGLENGCPFCGQGLSGVQLIDAYRVLFSDGYRALKQRVTDVGKASVDAFSEPKLRQLDQTISDNRDAHSVWQSHADYAVPDLEMLRDATAAAAAYREAALRVLRMKVAAPLEPIVPDEELVAAERAYGSVAANVTSFNGAVSSANATIAARKARLGVMDVSAARGRVDVLSVFKRRQEPQLKALCGKVGTLTAAKEAQEAERDRIKGELDGSSGDLIVKYQASINRYLDLFGAGFSIAKVDHNYLGGVNASYHLLINQVQIPLGDEKTPLDRPSFKNTLSAGDRSTLALALFLAQLDHDVERGTRIVVLDDPFNSQDSFRRNQTAIEITRLAPRVAQVVVLSHDARFLKEVLDKAHDVETRTLKLNPVGESTEICSLDLSAFLQSEAKVLIDMLQAYYAGTGGEPRNVIQKIRPLLETYCQNSCMTLFDGDDILSTILSKIRVTGDTHPLWPIYHELNDVNDYTVRHHHADGTVTGVINETELRTHVKRTLRLVGAMMA